MVRNRPYPGRCSQCRSSEHEQPDCRNDKRACFPCGSLEHLVNRFPSMKTASGSATRLPYKKENRTTPASVNEKAGPRGTVRQ
jgi:hypothetical protein